MADPLFGPSSAAAQPDAAAIEAWIESRIAELLGEENTNINAHKPIAAYGVDSVEAAQLSEELEEWLQQQVPADLIWEWASTREISERLAAHLSDQRG